MNKNCKRRVLFAEDDEDIRELVRTCLESLGDFEVLSCENGEGIVEKATAFLPDIISLDVMMPVVGGLKALENLLKVDQFKNVPIVLMTAKAMDEEVKTLAELNVAQIITKPFHAMELSSIFHKIIDDHTSA